jgi:hypothetical protein
MFKTSLVVESQQLSPEEIAKQIGVEADRVTHLGVPRNSHASPARFNAWIKNVTTANSDSPRTEDIYAVLESWGADLPVKLGRLAKASDASVALSIVQDVDDLSDTLQVGIHFDAATVKWLSTACAVIDIDQYFPD